MWLGIKHVKRKAELQKAELKSAADFWMKSELQKGLG